MRKKIKKWTSLCLAGLLSLGLLNGVSLEAKADTYGENLIVNPVFAEEDVSVWQAASNKATISIAKDEFPIYDDVTTYGVISDRTSPYECFAQDVTAVIENGKKYEYSFYAMLSGDYEGAPADQRVLDFAPYVTVDGQTSYLGSYSAEIKGVCSQTLTPYEWTKYEGTFEPDYSGTIDQVVIRLLEQGTNYGQGECVLGEYYVTGMTLREVQEDPVEIEDIPSLCDAVIEDLGDEDMIVSTVIGQPDLSDDAVLALVQKHFNAVTFGNVLKPDALFGYSNDRCPGTETVTFNGEEMVVPKMDTSRAERMLDKVLEWNSTNPDKQIKVRGHVLVWHSQTPEWFFHEDYDKSKDYVSKEEMDKRLEWYIATVLDYFAGEESPYRDLFYAWDVVNEAVSDGGGYRTDKEKSSESLNESTHGSNSSWWHVYQSEEYIINAFRYANKYAPEHIELYYNDYNECGNLKRNSIVNLLTAVKEAEGTRLDGMGMQAHYSVSSPDTFTFENTVRLYAKVAGKVQITEWDMTASSNYDGTDATEEEEYLRMAKRYRSFYDVIKRLKADGVDINAIVVWSTIDSRSWLQGRSNVGGGTDGTQKQCPALFDDDYKAKPAYWAFVDPSMYLEKKPEATEAPEVTEAPAVTEEPQATEVPVTTEVPAATQAPATQPAQADGASEAVGVPVWLLGVGAVAVVGIVAGVIVVNKGKKKK
ncbi:MAG: endo-1,4-beta-xylanase [Lachnospiraceae bacterium]|nr:endo-1,4-beta-xylanase [Lachnospiraceae bacterium]